MSAKAKAVATACFALWVTQAFPETLRCMETDVVVTAQNAEHARLACDAAQEAMMLFASCGVPALTGQTTVKVVEELRSGCFGLYDCETQSIEVLSPDVLHDLRLPDSIFSHVATPAYFQSVVVHELAHAASDGIPCPFDSCIVGLEYIAYLMQMKSLDPVAQDQLAASIDMDAPVSFKGFHPFILMLAPDVFSQRVWAHHQQQDDPCSFVGALIRGETILDIGLIEPE